MHDDPDPRSSEDRDFDLVDEASAESFPASDAPGWATGQLADEDRDDERARTEACEKANRGQGPEDGQDHRRPRFGSAARGEDDSVRRKSA